MLKRIIYRMLERRHFWRYAGFDQLSELYTSMMLRSMGLSLVAIFIPIYLYLGGYELLTIALFMAGIYATRMPADILAGYVVAVIGPKHVIFISYVLQAVALALLLTLPGNDWPLWWIAVSSGMSLSAFFVSYHISFSKIMHADHGGKELGIMTIMERLGAALGPVVGGVIATLFGAEYTIAAALVLFILATVPLLFSPEPTKRHALSFHGLPYRKLTRDFISFFSLNFEANVAVAVWPLYVAIFVVTVNVYASVGLVTTIGVVASMVAARVIGVLIDRQRGRALLRVGVCGVALAHLVRPFVGSIAGVAALNSASDAAGVASRLPHTKGMYGRADDLSGFRIAYITVIEVAGDFGKTCAWLVPAGLLLTLEHQLAFQVTFVIAAVVALGIMLERFPVLNPRRFF